MRRLALTLLVVLFLAPALRAETTGSLAGAVRTSGGTALPQLMLTLSGPTGDRVVVTGTEGRYRISGLVPGEYALKPKAPGFVLSPTPRATVGDGETRLDLTLLPAPVREQVVVSATRGDAALSTLGVSATVLDREHIAAREASSVLDLLRDVPGLAEARLGGIGPQASVFVRGGESRFARILIDGVPVNEPGGAYNFGSQLPLELDRVEVVRGAASSLYGTDALAGVIHLVTRRAEPGEALGFRAEAEGGTFSWRRLRGGSSGQTGHFDWNVGAQRVETDNEQPNSAFAQTAWAASLGARPSESSTLRLLVRGDSSDTGTPGPTAYRRPDLDASYEASARVLGALYRQTHVRFTHEVRVGFSQTNQLSQNPRDSGPYVNRYGDRVGYPGNDFPDPAGFQNDTRRLSLTYQAEVQVGSRNLLTAGADLERETGALGSRTEPLLSPQRTNVGGYVQDRLVLADRVFLVVGGRIERNDNFGTKAVPRAALAVRIRGDEDATTLRASVGAGIKEPSFFESFGVSFFAQGNPGLKPERSLTFDAGIEQRFFRDRLRAEATYFNHDYRDQIAYTILDFTTFRGTYVNLGETRGRGVELALEAAPTRHVQISAQYTFLDGKIVENNDAFENPIYAKDQPLLRRPRHQASLSARGGSDRLSVGASLLLVGRRADSDFAGLGFTENQGYARLDARLRASLGRGFEAFVVAENVLDRRYQEVLGYPSLGRTVRAGLRFRSGEHRP